MTFYGRELRASVVVPDGVAVDMAKLSGDQRDPILVSEATFGAIRAAAQREAGREGAGLRRIEGR